MSLQTLLPWALLRMCGHETVSHTLCFPLFPWFLSVLPVNLSMAKILQESNVAQIFNVPDACGGGGDIL